jgi:glycosyltransferase involved in cell wall biosynthesis
MVPVKDVPTLLRAFATALPHAPHLRLVLAGDGPGRPAAEALVQELGVGARVHFAGWVADLPRFYASLDVFVLSSLNEGTPVAAIEAMAAARPVIATAVGGVPDVVADGETGLLVPSRDAVQMAAAFVDLASGHERRLEMGRRGRERARARYSHTRLVDDIDALYGSALARKRRVT